MQGHALEAVSADAVDLMALVLGLLNHPKGALLTPGLLPAMAMHVIESRKALRVLEEGFELLNSPLPGVVTA